MLKKFKNDKNIEEIKWSIILIKDGNDEWYINYIKNKLFYQINALDLIKKINILILNNIEDIKNNLSDCGDYINIIEEGDISDQYINTIYHELKNFNKDCIGLCGLIYENNKSKKFNQKFKEADNGEEYLDICKFNPIKKSILNENLDFYLKNNNLSKIINNVKHIEDLIVFLKKNEKHKISIIITAYKTEEFIEECLNSIESQTYFENNDDFEILIGVDACDTTLSKLEKIKYKYRNLSVYMMAENKGTYITSNTLVDMVKYENVIRFDSDDIMCPDLVEKVLNNKKDDDIILLGYVNMINGIIGNNVINEGGIIYFKKSVMDNIAGGWKPWTCAADTELKKRLKNKVKISKIKDKLFIRRIHENSLTNRIDTGYNSDIRKEYTKLIKDNYNDDEIKIDRVVNNIRKNDFNEKKKYNFIYNKFDEHNNDEIKIERIKQLSNYNLNYNKCDKYNNKKIGIVIVNYNNLNYTKNCVDDLLKQINKNFELYLIDQNSNEYGTKKYLKEIRNFGVNVIINNENIYLNRVWNDFYNICDLDYLCFLNNDIRLTNNFTDDILNIFKKEPDVGVVIHVTNNLTYTISEHHLKYEILIPPLNQGWDYCIRRELYNIIPDTLKIFGGEDFLYSNLVKTHKVALAYSSPLVHYKEKTRNIVGDTIKKIHEEDIINFQKEALIRGLEIIPPTYSTTKCNKYAPSEINLTQNKKCVFTASIGGYDDLSTSTKNKQLDWDYVCYSDDNELKSDFWKIINIQNDGNDVLFNHKLARQIKTNFFKYLSSYNFLLWKDCRIVINCDLNDYFKLLGDNDILFMKHPDSNSILEEFDSVSSLKLENIDVIEKIKIKYAKNNYNYDNGLMATGIMLFRNNDRVINFFKDWWDEIEELSYRDQLSANYVLSKNPKLIYDSIHQDEIISNTGYFLRGVRKTKRFNHI